MENYDDMQRARMVGAFDIFSDCIVTSLRSMDRLKWLRKRVTVAYDQCMLSKRQAGYLVSWIDVRLSLLNRD